MNDIDRIEQQMACLEALIAQLHRQRNALLCITVETEDAVREDAINVYGSDDVQIAPKANVERVSSGYWVDAQLWVWEL